MPLLNGSSDEIMNENVAELRRTGYPEDQAVAIALKKQREAQKADDEQAVKPESPLAAAAKRAQAVREGKMSASDAANTPTEVSDDVDAELAGRQAPAKTPENAPGVKDGPVKKAPVKKLPKFKTRSASSHTVRR